MELRTTVEFDEHVKFLKWRLGSGPFQTASLHLTISIPQDWFHSSFCFQCVLFTMCHAHSDSEYNCRCNAKEASDQESVQDLSEVAQKEAHRCNRRLLDTVLKV